MSFFLHEKGIRPKYVVLIYSNNVYWMFWKTVTKEVQFEMFYNISDVESIKEILDSGLTPKGKRAFKTEKDLFDYFIPSTATEISKFLVGFFDESDFSEIKPPEVKLDESAQTLKCKCYYCQIDLHPGQYYRFDKEKYDIMTQCQQCGRKDSVLLTKEQIKSCNEQGGYQMSLGK